MGVAYPDIGRCDNATYSYRIDDPDAFNFCSVPRSAPDACFFAAFAILTACFLQFSRFSAVFALLAGAIWEGVVFPFNLGRIGNSTVLWLGIDPPELFFYVFLPPLLLDAAMSIDWFLFRKLKGLILAYALLIVLATAAVMTPVLLYGLRLSASGWLWQHGALFASMVAPTDALAISAVLRRSGGVDAEMTTLLEGESLLNDASALTLFKLLFTQVKQIAEDGYSRAESFPSFCFRATQEGLTLSSGGIAVGLLAGALTRRLIKFLRWNGTNGTSQETAAILAVAYLVYYVADALAGVSGIIAVVVFGLYGNACLGFGVKGTTQDAQFTAVFQALAFALNAIVFFFAGTSAVNFTVRAAETLRSFTLNVAVFPAIYVSLIVSRCIFIAFIDFLSRRVLQRKGIGKGGILFATWGGLRGALCLIMAQVLVTDEDLAVKSQPVVAQMGLWTALTVLSTLLLHPPTVPRVLKAAGLVDVSYLKTRIRSKAKRGLLRFTLQKIDSLKNEEDEMLRGVDWAAVSKYCDFQSDLPGWDAQEDEHDYQSSGQPEDLTSMQSADEGERGQEILANGSELSTPEASTRVWHPTVPEDPSARAVGQERQSVTGRWHNLWADSPQRSKSRSVTFQESAQFNQESTQSSTLTTKDDTQPTDLDDAETPALRFEWQEETEDTDGDDDEESGAKETWSPAQPNTSHLHPTLSSPLLGRPRKKDSRGCVSVHASASTGEEAAERQGSVREARRRLLAGMKNYFASKRTQGLLSAESLRRLTFACDQAIDQSHRSLAIWQALSIDHPSLFEQATSMAFITTKKASGSLPYWIRPILLPILRKISGKLGESLSQTMLVSCECSVELAMALSHCPASGWLRASEHSAPHLQKEMASEISKATRFIIDREIEAPQRFQAIQTLRAAMAVLHAQSQFVHQLASSGVVDVAEEGQMLEPINRRICRLELSGPAWKTPSVQQVLRSLPFLQGSSQRIFQSILEQGGLRHFSQGDVIWAPFQGSQHNDTPDSVMIVIYGLVKSSYTDKHGQRHDLYLGSGGVIGLFPALLGRPIPGTGFVEAQADALHRGPVVFCIPYTLIRSLLRDAALTKAPDLVQLEIDMFRVAGLYCLERMRDEIIGQVKLYIRDQTKASMTARRLLKAIKYRLRGALLYRVSPKSVTNFTVADGDLVLLSGKLVCSLGSNSGPFEYQGPTVLVPLLLFGRAFQDVSTCWTAGEDGAVVLLCQPVVSSAGQETVSKASTLSTDIVDNAPPCELCDTVLTGL